MVSAPEPRPQWTNCSCGRMHGACTKPPYFHFRSKIWRHHRVPRPPSFSKGRGNFSDSRTFKADIGLLNICMGFQDLLAWNVELGQHRGRGGAILTPNELVLPFEGSYVCANFGENRSSNATVRVLADRQIHTMTDWQTQTDFIICPMLYAIAMGQIKNKKY